MMWSIGEHCAIISPPCSPTCVTAHIVNKPKVKGNPKPCDIETWLEQLGAPSADRDYLPGHQRMQQLIAAITPYKPRLRIRVAGTNGKGSTSFMLAAALQATGLKVGLYTSPHLLSFNERIRIQGEPITDALLQAAMQRIMPIALRVGGSYFETATVLALDLFARAEVDVEILEAGVGARLDATTAVDADLALLTPIGLDHQQWLGDTIEAVATEKAYVMQGCRWSISAPQIETVSPLLQAFNPALNFCKVSTWPELAAIGLHQQLNASLAWAGLQALQQLLPNMDMARAKQAILHCQVPGRLQFVQINQAQVWLDAAHNRHAIEALLPTLPQLATPFDAIIVFTRKDRSLEAERALLTPFAHKVIYQCDADPLMTASTTLQQEITNKPQGSFLVLGSFITVAAILKTLPMKL
ncbi:MAG: cyanophycin synthetase [Mariprofundus sp.]|nr:cyanophycin synthetase [Mariprofundus sp.]